jgi:hypothetical protein
MHSYGSFTHDYKHFALHKMRGNYELLMQLIIENPKLNEREKVNKNCY